eukprot:scaffold167038_cov35-Tisochrysis_lutea.AAC.3
MAYTKHTVFSPWRSGQADDIIYRAQHRMLPVLISDRRKSTRKRPSSIGTRSALLRYRVCGLPTWTSLNGELCGHPSSHSSRTHHLYRVLATTTVPAFAHAFHVHTRLGPVMRTR